jgi:hypothetical protein
MLRMAGTSKCPGRVATDDADRRHPSAEFDRHQARAYSFTQPLWQLTQPIESQMDPSPLGLLGPVHGRPPYAELLRARGANRLSVNGGRRVPFGLILFIIKIASLSHGASSTNF